VRSPVIPTSTRGPLWPRLQLTTGSLFDKISRLLNKMGACLTPRFLPIINIAGKFSMYSITLGTLAP